MKKKWFLLILGLAAILAILGLTGCEQGSTASGEISNINLSSQQNGIWVTGQGEVSVKPDIAVINLGIEAEDKSVATARDRAAAAMNDVMDTLTSNGIAEKDIQTQYFNIQQVRTWDRETEKEVVTGYRVTNTVMVTIRDIEKVGTIIDAVTDAGGDLTRINGINFSIDDPDEYYEEARKEAMADAKNKAEQLAKLANVSLGEATFISENSYYAPIAKSGIAMAYDEAAGYSTSISPGELDINLSIQIAYTIK
ncbi:MAG: SIMPL domain-containing protein [Dehalococcoidales bacterium]|nr:MAG: SIMPL domain-containing protein [Dehalococcoidales bacterium]